MSKLRFLHSKFFLAPDVHYRQFTLFTVFGLYIEAYKTEWCNRQNYWGISVLVPYTIFASIGIGGYVSLLFSPPYTKPIVGLLYNKSPLEISLSDDISYGIWSAYFHFYSNSLNFDRAKMKGFLNYYQKSIVKMGVLLCRCYIKWKSVSKWHTL